MLDRLAFFAGSGFATAAAAWAGFAGERKKAEGLTLFLLLCLLTIYGCATPYEPEGFLGGYRDSSIGSDQFHITVQGNGYTNTGMVEQHFYRRAADIVKENGYSGYKVVTFKTSMEPWGLMCCFPVATGVIQGLKETDKGVAASKSMATPSQKGNVDSITAAQREIDLQLESKMQSLVDQLSTGLKRQAPHRIAVLPIRDTFNADSKPLGNYLSETLTNKLYATGLVTMVERAQLGKVIDELALTQSGRFDEVSGKRIGRLLGVDSVVIGTYAELGHQTIQINARVINVETGEVLGVGTIQIPRVAVQQMLR